MTQWNRREMLGSLGTLAVAGGWLGLTADEVRAQDAPAAGSTPREYTLPKLDYAYDALEPHIDAATMQLHHSKHHDGYVKGLNKALAAMANIRQSGNADQYAQIRDLTDQLSFHGSGHSLHTVFWKNMKPGGGGQPKGALAAAINRDFGSFSAFWEHFSKVSGAVHGSGWGILGFEPLSGRLLIFGAEKHQNLTMWGTAPLLVLDVWEHAYYLKHQNKRADYIAAFANVIDWDNVASRLDAAGKMTA